MQDAPALARPVTPAGRTQPGDTGRAFDVVVSRIGLPRGDGVRNVPELVRPRGLAMWIEGSRAALCRLSVGVPEGGAGWTRDFTVSAEGVWTTTAAWEFVKLEVLQVGAADVRVAWAWTTEQPPGDDSERMILVESIQAGTRKVPNGAVAVTPSSADAGFAFVTEQEAGVPLTILAPLTAATRREVLGDRYTAGVPNVVCWELWSP